MKKGYNTNRHRKYVFCTQPKFSFNSRKTATARGILENIIFSIKFLNRITSNIRKMYLLHIDLRNKFFGTAVTKVTLIQFGSTVIKILELNRFRLRLFIDCLEYFNLV